jgi:hypothetical protein
MDLLGSPFRHSKPGNPDFEHSKGWANGPA